MNKKTCFGLVNLILIFLIILLTSCTPSPTAEVVEKETIKIGAVLPLTGPSSDGGNYIRNGLLLALEEINAVPSLKNKYELIFEDSTYDPKTGVTAINKLISIDRVKYVVGDLGSSVTLAMAPIAEQNKVILVTPGSQSDKISEAGDFIFRTQINTAQEAKFYAEYLLERIGSEPIDILTITTAYGESIISNLQTEFGAKGGTIGLIQKLEPGESDIRNPLLKIKARNTKYVLMGTVRRQGAHIMKQAKELGMDVTFFATSPIEGKEVLEIAGEAAEGLIYAYPYDSESPRSTQKDFRKKYFDKYGHDNEMLAANGYDTLKILVKCIEINPDTEAVRDCLYNTKNYSGAGGVFSFDENGDVEKEFIIKTVKNGEFVKYEEEVSEPEEVEVNRKPRIEDVIFDISRIGGNKNERLNQD